jgi:hypothetical protein
MSRHSKSPAFQRSSKHFKDKLSNPSHLQISSLASFAFVQARQFLVLIRRFCLASPSHPSRAPPLTSRFTPRFSRAPGTENIRPRDTFGTDKICKFLNDYTFGTAGRINTPHGGSQHFIDHFVHHFVPEVARCSPPPLPPPPPRPEGRQMAANGALRI